MNATSTMLKALLQFRRAPSVRRVAAADRRAPAGRRAPAAAGCSALVVRQSARAAHGASRPAATIRNQLPETLRARYYSG